MDIFDKIEDKVKKYEEKYDEEDIPAWYGEKNKDASDTKESTDKNTMFDHNDNFNLKKDEDVDIIELLLPGYPEDNIDISVEDKMLIIDIDSTEDQDSLRYDYNLSNDNYITSDMTAKYKNGLIRIKIPKTSDNR